MKQQIGNIFKFGITAIIGVVMFGVSTGSALRACPAPQGAKINQGALAIRRLSGMAKLTAPQASVEPRDLRDADPNGAIVGMWHVTAVFGGEAATDEAFEQFFGDGNELMIDTTPPALDNVCNGVWVQTGALVYKVKHPSFTFDDQGNVTGTVIIRSVITLDRSAQTFTGTQTVDVFDNSGKLVDHFDGITLKGTRIKPD